MFTVTQEWCAAYPQAHAGFLAMSDVENPSTHTELENAKRAVENQLRAQFAGQDPHALSTFGPVPEYTAYYKQFNKTYHVLGQLQSIIFKGKSIPSVAGLVEAMFIAELKNGLLTAGHDLDQLQLPVSVGVAIGDEQYTLLRGQEQILKAGDMLIADRAGVISSIIYGPDQRTQIGPATKNVLFTVYAPVGIDPNAVLAHLQDIKNLVLLFAPQAKVQALQVVGAQAA